MPFTREFVKAHVGHNRRAKYRCVCRRAIKFGRAIERVVCAHCGTIHVRGSLAEQARELAQNERAIAQEWAVPGPTTFRVTEPSTITILGAGGFYQSDEKLRFVCTRPRCTWNGTRDQLVSHHDRHLAEIANRDLSEHYREITREVRRGQRQCGPRIEGSENA